MIAPGARKLVLNGVRRRRRQREKASARRISEGMMQLATARMQASAHRPKRSRWWSF